MTRVLVAWRYSALLLVALLLAAGEVMTSCRARALPDGMAVPSGRIGADPSGNRRLRIVATFSLIGDMVVNVAGNAADLSVLVGPNGDAHTYEPSPQDAATLAQADLIFEQGLGFETWMDRLYQASGTTARRIVVTTGITTIKPDEEKGVPLDKDLDVDPHTWHDLRNAGIMVANIRDVLMRSDPEQASVYQANAAAYLAQVEELDQYFIAQVATVPPERRRLVTSHDAFGYLAKRYGFEYLGSALGSVSTEVADPSAAELARLVEKIRAAGVPAIFAENVENPGLMQRIANEAGVVLAPTLYTDALGRPGTPGDTFLKMERYDIDAIVTALR